MNLENPIPVTEIASWIGASIVGNQDLLIEGINEIHKVRKGDITFVDHPKYFNASLQSAASAIIVPPGLDCPPGKAILIVEHPFLAYEDLVNRYRPPIALNTEARENYIVDPTTIIEPGAIIGQHVTIGKYCRNEAGAIIRPYSYLGDRVVVQSGAIIGSGAFYFKKWPDKYQGWTGCGRVIIGDDVFIGSGSTIAQGVSGDTIIGEGTKIDCQVMIGHGAVIGKHCLLAAQAGIAGKTVLGDWCVIYGQAGVTQNLNLGERTVVYAQSGVMRSLEGGQSYFGSPAEEAKGKFKELTALKKLADQYIQRKGEDSTEKLQ
jgi:UDP-3-O-[3-hydroxymyristoyl] glucosamine N-acyltransferase